MDNDPIIRHKSNTFSYQSQGVIKNNTNCLSNPYSWVIDLAQSNLAIYLIFYCF